MDNPDKIFTGRRRPQLPSLLRFRLQCHRCASSDGDQRDGFLKRLQTDQRLDLFRTGGYYDDQQLGERLALLVHVFGQQWKLPALLRVIRECFQCAVYTAIVSGFGPGNNFGVRCQLTRDGRESLATLVDISAGNADAFPTESFRCGDGADPTEHLLQMCAQRWHAGGPAPMDEPLMRNAIVKPEYVDDAAQTLTLLTEPQEEWPDANGGPEPIDVVFGPLAVACGLVLMGWCCGRVASGWIAEWWW